MTQAIVALAILITSFVGFAGVVAFFACLRGGLIWLAWNYGVAAVATVSPIPFWGAVCLGFGIGILQGIFGRTTVVQKS